MNIIQLDTAALDEGAKAFNLYASALICGSMSDVFSFGMCRRTGPEMIPGAIMACINRGMTTDDEIMSGVARATSCRRSTVRKILSALTGDDVGRHLFGTGRGRYYDLQKAEATTAGRRPHILMAV